MASYVLALPFWDVPRLPYPLILADLIFPVLLLASAARVAWCRDWKRSLDGFSLTLLLLYPAAVLLPHLRENSLQAVLKLLYLVGIALVVRTYATNPARRLQLCRLLFISAVLAALSGLAGGLSFYCGLSDHLSNPLLSKYGSMPVGPYPRVNGLFANANMLCNFLLMGVFFAWEMDSTQKSRTPALLVLLVCALFTFSPGLGAIAWGWGYRERGWRKRFGYFVALLIVLINLFSFTALTDGSVKPSTRVLCWGATLESWSQRPLLGQGVDRDLVRILDVTPSQTQVQTDPHNSVLSVLGHSGLIGLVSFLLLTLPILRGRYTPLKGMFFAGMFLQGLFGSFEECRHLWVLIGALLAERRNSRASSNTTK